MRNLKRVLSLALALVMVLGMMVIGTSAATFTDAEEITQTEAVEVLSALGIVDGMGDGTFAPNGTFTREQAAKLIAYMKLGPAIAEKLAGTDTFSDVAASRWSSKYIAYCANLGYIVGLGDGTFNPNGKLTDIELGKLVLCAIGYDSTKYVGPNWAAAVTIDMLEAGLVDNVTGTVISRENACALVLEGLKYSKASTTWNIVDENDVIIGSFADLLEATLYAKVLTDENDTYSVKKAPATDNLLATVYGATYDSDDNDAFGRPAVSYTIGKDKLVYADEATYTYTSYMANKAGKKQIAADLGAAGVKLTATDKNNGEYSFAGPINVYTDGYVKTYNDSNTSYIAGYTKYKDGVTVEVFVSDKAVTDVVVIENHAEVVADFVEADAKAETEAYIVLNDAKVNAYETEDFAKGDVVLYTRVWNADDDKYDVVTIEKAAAFVGKLTAYNTDNEFVINGETYTISYGPVVAFNTLRADIQKQLGLDYVYYLGTNGEIVYAHSVKGATPAVITDYAYVLATDVDYTTTKASASFGDAVTETVSGVVAMVKVVLSDGTSGVYTLAVEEDDDVYTVEINGEDVELYGDNVTTEAAADAVLASYIGKIFTYTAAESEITLVGAASYTVAEDTVYKTALDVDGNLINAETVVVLGKLNAKTGKIDSWFTTSVYDLEDTVIENAQVFKAPVKDEDDNVIAYVAKLIFAVDTAFDATDAVEELDVDSIVYINGDYTTTLGLDSTGKTINVYTYTGVKVDGTKVDVIGAKDLDAGVYMVNSKGVAVALDETVATAKTDKVVAFAGTTYQLETTFVTISADVEPVALSQYVEMGVGAEITYIVNAKGIIVAVYVVG